jgi:hypothetical protein
MSYLILIKLDFRNSSAYFGGISSISAISTRVKVKHAYFIDWPP